MPGHKPKKKRPAKKPAGKSWEEALGDGSFGRSLREGRLVGFRPIEVLVDDPPKPPDLGPQPVLVVGFESFEERHAGRSGLKPDGLRVPSLSPQEQYVIFAALAAMVADNHTVQDQMTEAQWTVAEGLYERFKVALEEGGIR